MAHRSFWLYSLVFGWALSGLTQSPLAVDSQTLGQHRVRSVPPVYPAIAKAAQVQGTVVLQVTIGVHGNVRSEKIISGPPMLQQEAIDCVKQWTYRPFKKGGVAVEATGQVSLIFTLGEPVTGSAPPTPPPPRSKTVIVKLDPTISPPPDPNDKVYPQFSEAWEKCTRGVLAHNHDQATADMCRAAADLAAQFPPDRRFIEKRTADVYAATALGNAQEFRIALVYADRAVDVVKLGHDDNSGSNAAYSIRGNVEAFLGDFDKADRDLTAAEDFERKAIASVGADSQWLLGNYRGVLARDLKTHAAILSQLNRPADAQAKLDEAARL